MSFESFGDISKRVLRKAWLRKYHPNVFIMPSTNGGRWFLKCALKAAYPDELSKLYSTDFDEEYRQAEKDHQNYLYSIGEATDQKEGA